MKSSTLKHAVLTPLLVASLLAPLTTFSASGTVAKVWAGYSNIIDNEANTGWVSLSDRPTVWISISRMAQSAMHIIKAAKPTQVVTSATTPNGDGTESIINLSVTGGSSATSAVHDLLFFGNNVSSPNPFAFATINGTTAGLLTTPAQAAVAAISFARSLPTTYIGGCAHLYNTYNGINTVERFCNVILEMTIN